MKMMKSMLLAALFMSVLVSQASAEVPSAPPSGLKDLGIDATLQFGPLNKGQVEFNENKDLLLKDGERTGAYAGQFAFHTDGTDNWFIVTLKSPASIKTIYIQNRVGANERAKGLTVSVSNDQKTWKEIWKATDVKPEWTIDLKTPENAKYIKFELPKEPKSILHLNNVRIYGN